MKVKAAVIVLKLIWDMICVFGKIGVTVTDSGLDEILCNSSQSVKSLEWQFVRAGVFAFKVYCYTMVRMRYKKISKFK